MLFRDRICAVIAAPTAREMIRQLRCALKLTRTVELRYDWLRNENARMEFGLWLRMKRPPGTMIATCRRREAGGRYPHDVPHQLVRLSETAFFGASWCDVEWETLREWSLRSWRKLILGNRRVMTSFHDSRETPQNLPAVVDSLQCHGGDAIKIATRCNSIADSLRLLALCKGRRDVIAVPMGEIGLPARVLALREGSALAYAAVGEKTAPGQLTLDEMKNLYRADKLDRRTRVYGVIGDPVSHSLSPLMHNVAFQARRINAVYLPFLVRDLRDFLAAIKPLGIAGFSVTLPYKERILRHLDECDPLAARIGAVNTVLVRSGKLYGYNTDYVGVLRALERRVQLAGSRVLIYGAGGAARAVAFALAQAGAVVCVSGRRRKQVQALARAVGGEAVACGRLPSEYFDAIINATPVGMHPWVEYSPLEARELNCRIVFDTIYRPMKTKLLRVAERKGIETVSGVEMFIAQGVAQWEIWTRRRAPEAAMRRAVVGALKKEEVRKPEV